MTGTTSLQKKCLNISKWIFIGLLAYMPLHVFLSTWIGTSFHILSFTKVLKDIVLVIGFGLVLIPAVQQRWFRQFYKDPLVLLILAYTVLTILMALWKPTDSQAEVLGVVYNTRFLVFFLYALLLNKQTNQRILRDSLIAVFASAVLVLVFGVIQYTVLPNNALTHIGYGRANGVLPAFFIDDKPNLERIMSTLRDPNSLGSYIIIIISLATALLIRRPKQRMIASGLIILGLLCLWQTFSRSAWVGSLVALGIAVGLGLKRLSFSKKQLTAIGVVVGAFLVLSFSILLLARNSYFVKNVVFHADQSTVLENPNQLRMRFWRESSIRILHNPIGGGPGTAGIVSIRNKVQGTKLNENYYLQVGSEVGIVGLVLFLGILSLVALRLFAVTSTSWVAVGLFAAFCGLLVTNFLVHIWSNEAVAYTWWGLAGLLCYFQTKPTKQIKKNHQQKLPPEV